MFGFPPAKYFFYEGTCHVRLGQPDAALAASAQALALYQPTKAFNEPTIARIDMAMAYADKGDLDRACQLTSQAAAIPVGLRTGPIMRASRSSSPAWNQASVVCQRSRRSASNSPSPGPRRQMAHEPSRPWLAARGADTVTVRSYLFAPGDQARKLQHAIGSGADAIIADLEDAVAPSAKANARHIVANWLSRLDGDQPQLWVRVNSSPRLQAEDIQAVVGPAVTGICLPKTHAPEQLRGLGELLGTAERQAGLAEGALKVVP